LIKTTVVERVLRKELIRANTVINDEVFDYLKRYNGPFCSALKENVVVSKQNLIPLCQDTGMLEFFVFLGHKVALEEPVETILTRAVKETYVANCFRTSVVDDPIFQRKNTLDNTPAVVHVFHTQGNQMTVKFLVKGGGSENLTRLFMLSPTATVQEISDLVVKVVSTEGRKACPPLNVGIGLGGTADKALLLSRLALTKSFSERNSRHCYARLEEELLRRINELHLGYQGLGCGLSAYSVHIEFFPTHIATLPVAISFDCYLGRRGVVEFVDNGSYDG